MKRAGFDGWTASFVDGAGGKSVLPSMWPLLKTLVAGSIVMPLDEIAAAMRTTADRVHVVAEGAGGCAIAAALSGRAGTGKIVAVVSGGNIDLCPLFRTRSRASIPMSEERFATAAPPPARLHRLHELALDLWWSWDDRARQVFRRLDYSLWRATAHNPVQMLQRITPERLAAAAADDDFLKAYDQAIFGLDNARTMAHPWWRDTASMLGSGSIAYFSAEFALHQSLPIYAGGLGVLAGDHCKEAADLGAAASSASASCIRRAISASA